MLWTSQGVEWCDVELWGVWQWGSRKAAESGGTGRVESWARWGCEGGLRIVGSPGGMQRRRCQKGVRERGTGPAFMLLCECPRAWREPLRMAVLCVEELLGAISRSGMRWGVFAFHSSPFSFPCAVDLIL